MAAPFSARLSVLLEDGIRVKKDDVVVRLRNTEAEMARTQVEGQRLVSQDRIRSLQRMMLDERQLKPEERAHLAGELAEEREKLANLDGQLKLCEEKINDLGVRSPTAGLVVEELRAGKARLIPDSVF